MPGLWSVIQNYDKIYGFLTAPEQWYQNPKIQALKVFLVCTNILLISFSYNLIGLFKQALKFD